MVPFPGLPTRVKQKQFDLKAYAVSLKCRAAHVKPVLWAEKV